MKNWRIGPNKPSSSFTFELHAKFTSPIMERSILKFNNFRSVIL
nr:MAG TPA: hypothetical protein [Caudoviricetes sp.]